MACMFWWLPITKEVANTSRFASKSTWLPTEFLCCFSARGDPSWKVGLLAFSAYTNGRRLISVGPAAPDAITAISGLRVFSILWVMLGHRYRFMLDLPYMNKLEVLEVSWERAFASLWNQLARRNFLLQEAKNYGKEIILGGPLAVDTFFTIGAMLNTYGFFISMKKGRGVSIVQFIVHRYIRYASRIFVVSLFYWKNDKRCAYSQLNFKFESWDSSRLVPKLASPNRSKRYTSRARQHVT